MFSKKALVAAAAFLAVAGASTEAMAATVMVSVTGTVRNGSDMTGLFGAPGGSLDGQAFSLTYKFTTTRGIRENMGPGTYDVVYGGDWYGAANPTMSASLSIGGHVQSVSGQGGSTYYVCDANTCGGDSFNANAADDQTSASGVSSYNSIGVYFVDGAVKLPDTIDTSFTYTPSVGAFVWGDFLFQRYDYSTWTYQTLTQGTLNVASVTVAPVPLPAAGLALAGALAGLGALSRRRRAAA